MVKWWSFTSSRSRRERALIHTLATPLTNVLLELQHLQTITDQPTMSTELADATHQLENLAYTLRADHRDFQALERTEFNPAQLLTELLTGYHKPYGVCCQLSVSETAQSVCLFGRPESFCQIVQHLLNNAAESYPATAVNREINLSLTQALRGLVLMVADHGHGLRLWQKPLVGYSGVSFKTHRSGLGLPHVQQLVRADFAGWLTMISRYQQGTAVLVYFPTG